MNPSPFRFRRIGILFLFVGFLPGCRRDVPPPPPPPPMPLNGVMGSLSTDHAAIRISTVRWVSHNRMERRDQPGILWMA